MLFDCGWGELCEYGKHKSGRQTWITYQIDFMPKVSLPNSPAYRTNPKETKRENEKTNEVHNKSSHNTFSTNSIFLTRATPIRYPSSLSCSLPKVPTYTPYWIKNVKDDFFIPSSFPNNIISKQSFPTWAMYRTSFSELPTFQSDKSSLPISSCIPVSYTHLTLPTNREV